MSSDFIWRPRSDFAFSRSFLGLWMILGWGLSVSATCHAHFVWLVKEQGEYRIYFAETPRPDDYEMLGPIAAAEVFQSDRKQLLTLIQRNDAESGEGYFICQQATVGKPIQLQHRYGVIERGGQPFMLEYVAQYQDLATSTTTDAQPDLPLQATIEQTEDAIKLTFTAQQQPLGETEVTIDLGSGKKQTSVTDRAGSLSIDRKKIEADGGRIFFRLRQLETTAGEHEGKAYPEIRRYLTVVVDTLATESIGQNQEPSSSDIAPEQNETKAQTKPPIVSLPDLPKGLTSFGAAECRNRIFIYGGHTGEAHEYAQTLQSGDLMALSKENPDRWEIIASDEGVQGNALVAHRDQLYRLGGLRALNPSGEAARLVSIDDFHRFNFESGSWVPLPSLPERRSSFDAWVIDGKLYVVGGWTLSADLPPQWCSTAWQFDLDAAATNQSETTWQPIPNPPFETRALAIGQLNGDLIVVGGMESSNKPTRKVFAYSPQSQSWQEGPELPAGNAMEGFGSACLNVDGALIVSSYEGKFYRLANLKAQWEPVGNLEVGRFFHRMVPLGTHQVAVVGGANMEMGKFLDVLVQEFKN